MQFKMIVVFLLMGLAGFAQQPIGTYYNIRGIKMYCEVSGAGRPLVLIHGNGGNLDAFKGNIPDFAKRYKVIAVDSRAHGKSVDKGDSLSFEMMADDYAALLDAMKIDSAFVIGWSDGGIVALVMAMRHPEKVIRLAATGANIWPDSTALVPPYWLEEKAEYEKNKHTVWKTDEERNRWKVFMLDWLQPNLTLADMHTIKCPSLIIAGDHDLITLEHTVKIYQHIPHAQLWILPHSGHGTLMEHRAEFDHKVDEFFRSVL